MLSEHQIGAETFHQPKDLNKLPHAMQLSFRSLSSENKISIGIFYVHRVVL